MTIKVHWDLAQISSLYTKPVNCQYLWPAQSHETGLWHHKLSLKLPCLSLKFHIFYFFFFVTWAIYSMAGPYCALAFWKRQGRWVFPSQCIPHCTNGHSALSSVHSSYLLTHLSASLLSLLWGPHQQDPYLSIWSQAGHIIIGDYKRLSKVMFAWDVDYVLMTIQKVIILEIYHSIYHQQVSIYKICALEWVKVPRTTAVHHKCNDAEVLVLLVSLSYVVICANLILEC